MGEHGILLASDMDGTVIPLEHSSRRIEEVAEFRRAVEGAADLVLAYVTFGGMLATTSFQIPTSSSVTSAHRCIDPLLPASSSMPSTSSSWRKPGAAWTFGTSDTK